jgi:thiamine biosynthesis lipoprotein
VLAGAAALTVLAACSPSREHRFTGRTMGTAYEVRVEARLGSVERAAVADTIRFVLERLERSMSTYLPESEVSRLNRHPGGEPFAVSTPVLEALLTAREVSERSGGAFDVTVGALVAAWGFGAGASPGRRLADDEVAALRSRVGYEALEIDTAAATVLKAFPGLSVDLSGIGKGFAAARVGAALDALGHGRWLVDVGGELQVGDPPSGSAGWRIGVERPDLGPPRLHATFDAVRVGVATSGDHRDVLVLDGVSYAHVVDPRTGVPLRQRGLSVTVVHPSGAVADAWATALLVLGPEVGPDVASRAGVAALFVTRADTGWTSHATPGFPETESPPE